MAVAPPLNKQLSKDWEGKLDPKQEILSFQQQQKDKISLEQVVGNIDFLVNVNKNYRSEDTSSGTLNGSLSRNSKEKQYFVLTFFSVIILVIINEFFSLYATCKALYLGGQGF